MKKAKHFIVAGVLVVISTFILRWLLSIIFHAPSPASAEAVPIDILANAHYWIISFLFSLIMVLMLYAAVVFKRDPEDMDDGPHVHGNTTLEIVWTIVPLILVVIFAIWGAVILFDVTRADEVDMRVGVTGKQWSWSFNYPEQGGFNSGELVLPVNQQIQLQMNTEDVIHSFWVVEFRVKQDLLPGSTETLRITPTEVGDYRVRCAEICGTSHSQMYAPVRVVDQSEFDAWVAEKLAAPKFGEMTPEERGAFWYSAEGFGCVSCHTTDGTPGAGPTWQGVIGRNEPLDDGTTVTVDAEYIRNSITHPNDQIVEGFLPNLMPQNFEEQFAAKQAEILTNEGVEIDIIADLIAFMETLK